MPDPAWPCSPPEVNYLRLTGDGAAGTATTLSGAAWQTLVGCDELAHSLSALNTAVTALNFDGLGGAGSTTAVTGEHRAATPGRMGGETRSWRAPFPAYERRSRP